MPSKFYISSIVLIALEICETIYNELNDVVAVSKEYD
jgi:hypothetical protein